MLPSLIFIFGIGLIELFMRLLWINQKKFQFMMRGLRLGYEIFLKTTVRVLKVATSITGQVRIFVEKTIQFVKIFQLCNSCNEHQGHKPLFY
jgi:hypothetical protein